jgi:hypothetical protein
MYNFLLPSQKPKQVKIIIQMEELIKYLNLRIKWLSKENKFLKEQLNHCLTQLDLDNE